MTKVTMNQTNLESAIKSLRDLADDCEISRDTIVRAYNADGDTLASQGYREPEDFSASVNTAVQTVRDRADTIEKYKDNIVALNESGTASMDADGVITLTLPDDAALLDDPTDFASWAQATIDANDLKSLTESSDMTATSPSGRTYDQVIDSIRANSTDSGGYDADHRAAYSDALITAIGPENLTSLPISAQQHFLYNPPTGKEVNTRPEAGGDLASLLGTVLATASWSWSWDEARSRKVADAIVSSVDEEGEYGRISALNAILGGHDADDNHVNDLTFDRRLLVDLAEGLDDIDYQKVARAASYPEQGGGDLTSQGEARARATILGSSLSGYSFDPLTGVLDAMGNNSSAALAYLAPTTEDGAVDTSRVADLSARTWDEAGLAGYTGAVAAASSLRTSEVGNQSEQATQLAGSAIHSLARSTSADAYNEDAKARTGMLLANCPAELVVAAQIDNGQGATVNNPETGSPFPEATSDDMRTLIYDVADSTSAVTTMSSTVADYTHNHAVALAQEAEGDEQTKISALNNEYNRGAQAAGLIAGLADNRAADITSAGTAKSDGAESAASTALGAFSTAVSTGLSTAFPEATLASAAWSTFSTVSTPAAVDALTPDASYQASQGSEGLKSGLWVSLIRDTANLGLLRDTDFNPDKGTYGWLNNDARTIDLTGTDPATVHSEMVDWTNTINSSTRWASEYDPNIPTVADNMHEFFGSGRDSGHEFSTE